MNSEKGPPRKGRTNDILVTPTSQTQPWCPLLLEMSMQGPLVLTRLPDLLLDPEEKQKPLGSKRETNVSRLESNRKSFEMEEISSNVAKLITQSRRPGFIANNKLAWNKWTNYGVLGKNIDPFCTPLSAIVN